MPPVDGPSLSEPAEPQGDEEFDPIAWMDEHEMRRVVKNTCGGGRFGFGHWQCAACDFRVPADEDRPLAGYLLSPPAHWPEEPSRA